MSAYYIVRKRYNRCAFLPNTAAVGNDDYDPITIQISGRETCLPSMRYAR